MKDEIKDAVEVNADDIVKDPFEVIKLAAKELSIPLKDPKPNCKHCHGRGWIGRRLSGDPIPCPCIFQKEQFDRDLGNVSRIPKNRAERRWIKNHKG